MTAQSAMEMTGSSASRVLGRKMDSIPFSTYHVLIISVLALVGFIEGYDLFMTGSLLVLAKVPLQLSETDIQWLLLGPALPGTVGGFGFSAVGDQLSRKAMLLIGVIATTFLTLLIPLVQNAEQLLILRALTGLGAGGVWSAVYPVGAELMPAQHRRTYGAIYEMALASSFTVLPFVASLLAGSIDAFRFLAHCPADWRFWSFRQSFFSYCRRARAGICAAARPRLRRISSTRSLGDPAIVRRN